MFCKKYYGTYETRFEKLKYLEERKRGLDR